MTRVLSLAGVAVFAALVLSGCRGPGAEQPEDAAEQPILFLHTVHAGQNEIPCMYCHYTAERSTSAGIPSVRLCVGCHVPGSSVAPPEQATLAFPSADRDSVWHAEATKLLGYWQRQEAIPWVRVHKLPEHVKFPHSMHVRAGLQCQTCHGPVQEMEEVYQFSSLQMGWCLDCHRGEMEISEAELTAVRENSTFIRRIRQLAAEGATPEDLGGVQFDGDYPLQRASTDCFACHY